MKKSLALILAAIMLICAFAACGNKDTIKDNNNEEHHYGRFQSYFTNAPTTLNRSTSTDTGVSAIIEKVTGVLYSDHVTATRDGWEWFCELAEDYPVQVDDEGKVWHVPVKKDLKWANGDPLNANDFVYSAKQLLDPIQLNSQSTAILNSVQLKLVGAEAYYLQGANGTIPFDTVGIKAADDYTIEVTAEEPVHQINIMRFLNGMNLVYEPLYEAGKSADGTVTNWGTSVDTFMSCGPFMLVEWIPDTKISLDKNPNYVYPDEIHLSGIDYIIIPNSQTAIELFQQGKLDKVGLAYTDWETFEDDPRTFEYFDDSLMYMMINIGNPNYNNILGSLNFRKALFYGIDRQFIADSLGVLPATRFVRKAVVGDANTLQAFQDIPQDYVLTAAEAYQPEQAKAYLTKAYEDCGIDKASEDIMLSETATHIKAATEILQKQYSDLFEGRLTVSIRQLPAAQTQTLRRWHEDDPTSFDIALGSVLPGSGDPRYTFNYYQSKYNPPRTNWSDEEYDRIYAEALTLNLYEDSDLIVEKCQQLEKILLDNVIVNPVYERPEKTLYSERVQLAVDHYVNGAGFFERYITIEE